MTDKPVEKDKRLKYVDYKNWTMYQIGLMFFDWKTYGRIDSTNQAAVDNYLYKIGFNSTTLKERQIEYWKRITGKGGDENLYKHEPRER